MQSDIVRALHMLVSSSPADVAAGQPAVHRHWKGTARRKARIARIDPPQLSSTLRAHDANMRAIDALIPADIFSGYRYANLKRCNSNMYRCDVLIYIQSFFCR